ncbi:hypothetical protein HK405_008682 [Cladochytrium tenue]|nr:hypothetical protein HK405_008682 [Cladochytrium tenue]
MMESIQRDYPKFYRGIVAVSRAAHTGAPPAHLAFGRIPLQITVPYTPGTIVELELWYEVFDWYGKPFQGHVVSRLEAPPTAIKQELKREIKRRYPDFHGGIIAVTRQSNVSPPPEPGAAQVTLHVNVPYTHGIVTDVSVIPVGEPEPAGGKSNAAAAAGAASPPSPAGVPGPPGPTGNPGSSADSSATPPSPKGSGSPGMATGRRLAVWFRLVDASGQPYHGHRPTRVFVPADAILDDLRDAVGHKYPRFLAGVVAATLHVAPADGPASAPDLQSDASVAPLAAAASAGKPLRITVPPPHLDGSTAPPANPPASAPPPHAFRASRRFRHSAVHP